MDKNSINKKFSGISLKNFNQNRPIDGSPLRRICLNRPVTGLDFDCSASKTISSCKNGLFQRSAMKNPVFPTWLVAKMKISSEKMVLGVFVTHFDHRRCCPGR